MRWREVAERVAGDIAAGRWEEGARLPGVRALAREAGCSAGTAARAYAALRDAGVLTGSPRSAFAVPAEGAARAATWDRGAADTMRIAGSDDPALDALLRMGGPAACLAAGPRGSLRGLTELARGGVDAAAVHLLDVASGRWNEAFARGALAGRPVALIHLWRRDQGLVVPRGNPKDIRGVADLSRQRIAWRPAGSGSRLLLERLMRLEGAEPRPVLGSAAESHFAVAAAVAAGAADAGLAVRAVAESLDLEWIPLATEWFELALDADSRQAAEPLLQVLGSSQVQDRLALLPGYDLSMSGDLRSVA
jgi:molybdate-binding protein